MTSAGQTAKTLLGGAFFMVVAGFVPAIVLGIAGWHGAVNVATLSGLAAFIACTTAKGWRTGASIAVPFAVLVALAVWAAPYPWLAALVLALAAFLRGYAARWGVHNALIMTVIALGFFVATPPNTNSDVPSPILSGLVALATFAWVTLIVFLLRRQIPARALTAIDPIRVLAFSLVLAFMVGVATWCVVYFDLGHTGGWIILTIVVVFQPSLGAGFKKAVQRAAGTAAGFVIAFLVGLLISHGPALYLAGAVFLIAAMVLMMQGRPYWLFATLLTPGIVLLESAGSTVDAVAEERLEATLAGVAGVLIVMLVLAPFSKRLEARNAPTPTANANDDPPDAPASVNATVGDR